MKEFNNFYLPKQYFKNVCRVCLSEHNVLIPIQEINLTHNLNPNGSVENVNLKTVFQKFCNVEVTASDDKPQEICEFCINMVGKAFNFFQLFLYSNALLDKKLEEHKLSQITMKPNERDEDNNGLISTEDNSCADLTSNLNNSSSHGNSDNINVTTLLFVNEMHSTALVPTSSNENVVDTVIRRKTTRKRYKRPPQKTSSVLMDHDYGVLDPVKKTALKLLMKLNKKFKLSMPETQSDQPREGDLGNFEPENEIFKCRFCLKKLDSISKVIQHLRDEHENLKRCILCPAKFNFPSRLLYHVSAHSTNGIICKTCRIHFETKEALDHHMENVDHTNTKKCPKCQRTFKTSYNVRDHIDKVHLKKYSFQCGLCGKMFRYKANMDRHEESVHRNRKFLCQFCGKSFSTNYQLKRHVQEIHNLNQGVVIKKYSTKKGIGVPRSRNTYREKRFKCKFCPKKFYNSHPFMRHCELHPEFKEYRCDVCNELLETSKEYLDHYRDHKIFRCPHPSCVLLFATQDLAFRHKYCHRKPSKCAVCGLAFKMKKSLMDHMNIHTGQKPYMCEQCGQGFKQMHHLETHIISLHGGKKPWQCQLCDKAFSYKSNLKCHMRSHTGEKPFPCLFCKRIFRDTTGRHKHVKKDHPNKMSEFQVYKENYQAEEMERVEFESYNAKKKKDDIENDDDDQ